MRFLTKRAFSGDFRTTIPRLLFQEVHPPQWCSWQAGGALSTRGWCYSTPPVLKEQGARKWTFSKKICLGRQDMRSIPTVDGELHGWASNNRSCPILYDLQGPRIKYVARCLLEDLNELTWVWKGLAARFGLNLDGERWNGKNCGKNRHPQFTGVQNRLCSERVMVCPLWAGSP